MVNNSTEQNALVAVARPLYSQVREIILARIKRGEWAMGDALPNEFLLASEFQVSIGTLRRAIEGLEDAGIVVRRQGRGTYVAAGLGQNGSSKTLSLRLPFGGTPLLVTQGVKINRKLANAADAKRLQCTVGANVFEIEQRLLIEAKAVGYERLLIPQERVSDLDKLLTRGRDLQSIYIEKNLAIARVVDQVSVEEADTSTANALNVKSGRPLLSVYRSSFALDQTLLESKKSQFLPECIVYANEIDRP